MSDQPIGFKEFLERMPPGVRTEVGDLVHELYTGRVSNEPIEIHCDDPKCGKVMTFDCVEGDEYIGDTRLTCANLKYLCRHCKSTPKWFSLLVVKSTSFRQGMAIKLGEYPSFGPHTPPRVFSVIEPDRELYLKGRRSESMGLGIGAFTYYRRVVENQWQRLIGQIIAVADTLNSDTETLKQARGERQFAKAVKMVKDAVPQSLLINGHNPMTLLHSALSEAIHELTDEQCLEKAQYIRVVLADFADRVGEALKGRAELNAALTKIFHSKSPKKAESQTEPDVQGEKPEQPEEES